MAQLSFGKKKTTDMTSGNILKLLVLFAWPLLLGNAFQQFYNTVDSWVVGNYVSSEAFSAVGTLNPIVNLFVSFFTGMSTGCGVVVSQYYGAGRADKVSTAVHSGFVIILVMGLAVTFGGILISPLLLKLMNTPAEVSAEANTYLKIYCCGLIFLTVYNLGAAILRAVGDSARPTIYLIVTAVINIILDLLFVIAFDMGVAGVAWATVIAEAVSMILIMVALSREKSAIRFRFRNLLHPDWAILQQIISIGIPAGVQTAIISFSNIFVHSYVNAFGTSMMGGYAAYMKVEKFAQLPQQSIQLALTTFVGQNIGYGNIKRAKEGVRVTMALSLGITAAVCLMMYFTAPYLVGFFSPDAAVIEIGSWVIRLMIPFTLIHSICPVFAGGLRGAGESRSIMFIMIGSYVVYRQIYLYLMTNYVANTPQIVVLSVGTAWLLATFIVGVYYFVRSDEIFRNAVPEASKHRIIE